MFSLSILLALCLKFRLAWGLPNTSMPWPHPARPTGRAGVDGALLSDCRRFAYNSWFDEGWISVDVVTRPIL